MASTERACACSVGTATLLILSSTKQKWENFKIDALLYYAKNKHRSK